MAKVADVPALLRYRDSPQAAAGHGTVLFYHGFGGTKERPGAYLTALAEAGVAGRSLGGNVAFGHFLTAELDTDSGQGMVAWFQRWLTGEVSDTARLWS